MKKIHIILIALIAVVAAILVSTYTAANTSVTFSEAKQTPGKEFKVSGFFDPAFPVENDPLKDANLTVFNMKDKNGETQRIYLNSKEGRPVDLERSESVNLFGSYNDAGEFHATDIQMKCPSKYNQNKHLLETAAN
ncbi:MAG: cytochrome c maturation protein CcmE [Flavobacteriales bacterium]|nr:cytochrome c maturation protein CcmE [Flavobacteriales bacterium]